MKREVINLFFTGDEFYSNSKMFMSSLYYKGTYKRCDWGKVQVALKEGKTVKISPATAKEMAWAKDVLNSFSTAPSIVI